MKSMLLFIWGLLLVTTAETRVEIIPSLGYIELNESKVFVCAVEGAVQEMKWIHSSGKPIKEGEDERLQVEQAGKMVSKLVIRDAQLPDAGRYQCVCHFNESYTETAFVTVTIIQKPTFLNPKTYHEFLEGSDALVPCDVTGIPQPLVTWKRKGQDVMRTEDGRFLLTAQGLLIRGVRGSDQGLYRCEGRIVDRGEVHSLDISVVVNDPPTARIREGEVNAMAGSGVNVSLTCLVNGHPHPYINWTRNGDPVVAEPGRFGFNSDQSVLTIYAVEKTDEGQYTCIATNKINSSSANVTLHVSVKPEVQLERSKEARPQESTSITCNATGDPLPTMHWVRKGNKLVPDSRTEISQQPLSSSLTLQKVEPSDGGIYTCVAASPVGEDRRDVIVQTIPSTPDNVRANPGAASVDILMESPKQIEGAEILRYKLQWREEEGRSQWSTTTVEANNSLTIAGLLSDTSYEVRVAAINKIGEGGFSAQHKVRTLASEVALSVSEKPGVGTGGIVGIVMVIFLVLLIAVDTTCYFTNHCGLMMCVAVNLLGKRRPGAKGLDEEERNMSTVKCSQ